MTFQKQSLCHEQPFEILENILNDLLLLQISFSFQHMLKNSILVFYFYLFYLSLSLLKFILCVSIQNIFIRSFNERRFYFLNSYFRLRPPLLDSLFNGISFKNIQYLHVFCQICAVLQKFSKYPRRGRYKTNNRQLMDFDESIIHNYLA